MAFLPPKAFETILDRMLAEFSSQAREYIAAKSVLGEEPGRIAREIVRRHSMKNGVSGAVTGLGGPAVLPVAIPVGLYLTWRIQARMVVFVAHAYGFGNPSDLKTALVLLLLGDAAQDELKMAGINAATRLTRELIEKSLKKEAQQELLSRLLQRLALKLGERTMRVLWKLAPGLGAPIGFGVDWVSARSLGFAAIHYYSGRQ